MERQAALHSGSRLAGVASLVRGRSPPWRSIAALPAIRRIASAPGRVSWDAGFVTLSSVQRAPRGTVLVPSDSMPGAARGRSYELRTQASAPCSAEMTSHDNALG